MALLGNAAVSPDFLLVVNKVNPSPTSLGSLNGLDSIQVVSHPT